MVSTQPSLLPVGRGAGMSLLSDMEEVEAQQVARILRELTLRGGDLTLGWQEATGDWAVLWLVAGMDHRGRHGNLYRALRAAYDHGMGYARD